MVFFLLFLGTITDELATRVDGNMPITKRKHPVARGRRRAHPWQLNTRVCHEKEVANVTSEVIKQLAASGYISFAPNMCSNAEQNLVFAREPMNQEKVNDSFAAFCEIIPVEDILSGCKGP